MGSELESTGNDSISSNSWILVGQFRSVETKMRQSLLLICSKLTKQIRIVLTVLCGVQVWTCGLMHIRLVLLFCVCANFVCVHVYLLMCTCGCGCQCTCVSFRLKARDKLGRCSSGAIHFVFLRQSFARSWGLQIILDQLAGLSLSPRDLPGSASPALW